MATVCRFACEAPPNSAHPLHRSCPLWSSACGPSGQVRMRARTHPCRHSSHTDRAHRELKFACGAHPCRHTPPAARSPKGSSIYGPTRKVSAWGHVHVGGPLTRIVAQREFLRPHWAGRAHMRARAYFGTPFTRIVHTRDLRLRPQWASSNPFRYTPCADRGP